MNHILYLAQTNFFSGATSVITGSVADDYSHEFEWWFCGFFIALLLGLAGSAIRLLRAAKGRAGDIEGL